MFLLVLARPIAFPKHTIGDVSLGLGERWVYEAHAGWKPSAMDKARGIVLHREDIRPGPLQLRFSADARELPSVRIEQPIAIGADTLLAIDVGKEARMTYEPLVPEISVRVRPPKRCAKLAAWLDDVLLCDLDANTPYNAINATAKLDEPELLAWRGPALGKEVAIEWSVHVEGEPEPRMPRIERHPIARDLAVTLTFEAGAPSSDEARRHREIAATFEEIVIAFRRGASYETTNKEGEWERIRWNGERYEHASGSYAYGTKNSTIHYPTDDAVIEHLVRDLRLSAPDHDRLTVLRYVLGRLSGR